VELLHTGAGQTDCTVDYHDAEGILYNGVDNGGAIRTYYAQPQTWTKLEGMIAVKAVPLRALKLLMTYTMKVLTLSYKNTSIFSPAVPDSSKMEMPHEKRQRKPTPK
jgi:hypothetical protein